VPSIELLLFGKLIVAWSVWVPFVKFPEFVQSAQREVVEGFCHPVFLVPIVVPLHEVKDVPAAFDGAYHFLDVVFLALLDVVCLAENLCRVRRFLVFRSSSGFDE
jgi:hypothetical protein